MRCWFQFREYSLSRCNSLAVSKATGTLAANVLHPKIAKLKTVHTFCSTPLRVMIWHFKNVKNRNCSALQQSPLLTVNLPISRLETSLNLNYFSLCTQGVTFFCARNWLLLKFFQIMLVLLIAEAGVSKLAFSREGRCVAADRGAMWFLWKHSITKAASHSSLAIRSQADIWTCVR